MIKYNHGQIGATLSWFVATLIIFFIIVLFLSTTIIFSSQKKISLESDVINLEEKTGELAGFEFLLGFLDKKILFDNEKTSIKKIVVKGLDKEKRTSIKLKLKEELDRTIKEDYNEKTCYIFDIEYPDSNSNKGFDVCSFTCTDEDFNQYVDQYKSRLLSKSIKFNLYSEKGVIKIKFYLGEC
ncbi:MAG: hypothetical protein PHF67_03205 [Candidatus Nanoarchaeia archaeon]|nr:hypothetical protein [Candidatus Nanoarchaeia archaeon]